MDCKAARFLLSFPATGPDALAGPEAAELRDHLDVCGECDALARNEARLDQHLGKAMRDVPVPSGLKQQVLARLDADRAETLRTRLLTYARPVAAAAAVLLLVCGTYWLWDFSTKPHIDASDVAVAYNVSPPNNADTVNQTFAALGFRDCEPDFVNYAFLASATAEQLPNYPRRKVPCLVFARHNQRVIIYVLPRREVYPEPQPLEAGYRYKVELVRPERPDDDRPDKSRWAYIVLYTGENWNWLRDNAE